MVYGETTVSVLSEIRDHGIVNGTTDFVVDDSEAQRAERYSYGNDLLCLLCAVEGQERRIYRNSCSCRRHRNEYDFLQRNPELLVQALLDAAAEGHLNAVCWRKRGQPT